MKALVVVLVAAAALIGCTGNDPASSGPDGAMGGGSAGMMGGAGTGDAVDASWVIANDGATTTELPSCPGSLLGFSTYPAFNNGIGSCVTDTDGSLICHRIAMQCNTHADGGVSMRVTGCGIIDMVVADESSDPPHTTYFTCLDSCP